jgi:hypothetical protein
MIPINGSSVGHWGMSSISTWQRALLASAYELSEDQVDQDVTRMRQWLGSDQDLTAALEKRHGWTVASENGPYYLAAMRQALT